MTGPLLRFAADIQRKVCAWNDHPSPYKETAKKDGETTGERFGMTTLRLS